MIENTCEISVRYAETDQMRFAHHSNYIIWFEHARIQLLKRYGFSYAELEHSGFLMPVLEINVRFHKYAMFDERLYINTIMPDKPGAKQKFIYEIYNQENERICSGDSLHTFMNKDLKAIRPPKKLIENLAKFF